jgi:hypothetical protein
VTANPNEHLTEAQILRAIVDQSDLSDVQQAHLADCPVCMAEIDGLDQTLHRFGNLAMASVPETLSRPVLRDRDSGSQQRPFFDVRPFFRIAVPVFLVLIIVTTALVLRPDQDTNIASLDNQVIDPEQLLADIDSLIENPLPQGFQSMVSFTGIDPDEDFMEYVVPITENEPLSNKPGEKGESIC